MQYLAYVGGSVVALLVGLFLVYRFNVTKEGPPATTSGPPTVKANPLGIFLDAVGGLVVVVSMIMLYILAVETGKHAGYRHQMGATSEGQFTVADRLRSAEIDPAKNDWIKWDAVENGVPLWYAVNVYVSGEAKPNTDVLASTATGYGPLPKEWEKVVVWYGTSQGPSIPQEIENPAVAGAKAAATAVPTTPST